MRETYSLDANTKTTGGCMSLWDILKEDKLMEWGITDRHRKRAFAEGFRDGMLVGCLIVLIFGGGIALWIK